MSLIKKSSAYEEYFNKDNKDHPQDHVNDHYWHNIRKTGTRIKKVDRSVNTLKTSKL